MRRLLAGLLLLPLLALAQTKLDLDVRLDPASRRFEATATLADPQGLAGFALAPEFEIVEMTVDGRSVQAKRDARGRQALPRGSREVRLVYRATLPPAAALDHRDVLGHRAPTAAPEGSFLPGAALWYPDPGRHFAYRLALALPPGQKGLVPGDLVKETDSAAGYRAEFDFPHPADGIDLMAGPYVVGERALKLPGGREREASAPGSTPTSPRWRPATSTTRRATSSATAGSSATTRSACSAWWPARRRPASACRA